MAFLHEDLQHLFDDQGIDASSYEDVVDFRDPITKYSSIGGYLFNIAFLKKAFNPKFELHESWVSEPTAVTTRWTMTMEFTLTKGLPLIGKAFRPTIVFTGTSKYVFNPDSGKIYRHIDIWDSIENQEYFSVEAFGDFFRQLLQPYTTPEGLETPAYTLLKRTSDYQIRRYAPFLVVECEMGDGPSLASSTNGSTPQVNPAGSGTSAFRQLAAYIFGSGNEEKRVMAMTTPVYSDTSGRMQFVVGPSAATTTAGMPRPVSPLVATRESPGGLFAVRAFNGLCDEVSAEREHATLAASLARDGMAAQAGSGWTLARYNGPGTPAVLRRNEVLVPLDEASFLQSWP